MQVKTPYEFFVYQYLTEEQIENMTPKWEAWRDERRAGMAVQAGSASYSGHRPVRFDFFLKEDAALFRLFFGGTTEWKLVPTLSGDGSDPT